MVNRRSLLKAGLALLGTVLFGTAFRYQTEAARRGTSGPTFSTSSGSVGYTFEIRSNRDGALSVVALPGRGPTAFSVTVVNRTSYDLGLDVYSSEELILVLRVPGNGPVYIELSGAGTYQFQLTRDDRVVSERWEARVPNPS